MERSGLLIGAIAARSGLSRKALRLYEARGILPPSRRTSSGYRFYPAEVVGLLTFVGRARRLGLTLAEIGSYPKSVTELRQGIIGSYESELWNLTGLVPSPWTTGLPTDSTAPAASATAFWAS